MKKIILILSIIALLLAGCENTFAPPDNNVTENGEELINGIPVTENPAPGMVRIYIGKADEDYRTLQPGHNNVEGYQLTFTGGTPVDPVNIPKGSNSADVYLANGIYSITAKAYSLGGEIGNPADEAATGSISGVNVSGGFVISNGGVVPPIILSPSGGGYGNIHYSVTVEDAQPISYIALAGIEGVSENYLVYFDGDYSGAGGISNGVFGVPAGRYIAEIKLVFDDDTIAYYYDVLEVWRGTITNLVFTPDTKVNPFDPDFGLAYSGSRLSESGTTFAGVPIEGSYQYTIGNTRYYDINVDNLSNTTFVWELDAVSQYADVSWVAINNSTTQPSDSSYSKVPITDFSANLYFWVKVLSEDGSSGTFYKFNLSTQVEFTSLTTNGLANYERTTKLTLRFNKDIPGLTASHINFSSTATGLVKGDLTRTGVGVYELDVGVSASAGTITVTVSNVTGYNILDNVKTANVHYANPATLQYITANGSPMETTTQITLMFDRNITGVQNSIQVNLGYGGRVDIRNLGGGLVTIDILDPPTSTGLATVTVNRVLNNEIKSGSSFAPFDLRVTIYYADSGAYDGTNLDILLWTNESDASILSSDNDFTISRSGAIQSFTAAVNEDYTNIQWKMLGSVLGTDDNITINAADYGNGDYFLDVLVLKDGVPYSTVIRFTVTN